MKYKVGDKVKITCDLCGHGWSNGTVVTITELRSGHYAATTGRLLRYINDRECEPYALIPLEPVSNICKRCNTAMVELHDEELAYECSVCGDIYLKDGRMLKNEIEEPKTAKTKVAPAPPAARSGVERLMDVAQIISRV